MSESFVTTEDRCSNCGARLSNAETSRLEWQAEAHRLDSLIKEAHFLLNSEVIAWTSHPGPWRDARDRWNESVKGLIK